MSRFHYIQSIIASLIARMKRMRVTFWLSPWYWCCSQNFLSALRMHFNWSNLQPLLLTGGRAKLLVNKVEKFASFITCEKLPGPPGLWRGGRGKRKRTHKTEESEEPRHLEDTGRKNNLTKWQSRCRRNVTE